MRSTEADRESAAIIAPTSGPFGSGQPSLEAGLRPHLLTRLP